VVVVVVVVVVLAVVVPIVVVLVVVVNRPNSANRLTWKSLCASTVGERKQFFCQSRDQTFDIQNLKANRYQR
jgi:hypothetical protein